jgi:hypothetical protein
MTRWLVVFAALVTGCASEVGNPEPVPNREPDRTAPWSTPVEEPETPVEVPPAPAPPSCSDVLQPVVTSPVGSSCAPTGSGEISCDGKVALKGTAYDCVLGTRPNVVGCVPLKAPFEAFGERFESVLCPAAAPSCHRYALEDDRCGADFEAYACAPGATLGGASGVMGSWSTGSGSGPLACRLKSSCSAGSSSDSSYCADHYPTRPRAFTCSGASMGIPDSSGCSWVKFDGDSGNRQWCCG